MAVDPAAVGRTIAHGAGDAQAVATAPGQHKATDVWTNTWHGAGNRGLGTLALNLRLELIDEDRRRRRLALWRRNSG